VHCSSGTYVRTLAADLGSLLGGGAHLRNLRRTAVGSFTAAESLPPDECVLIEPAAAMRDYATVQVDAQTAAIIATGRVLPAPPGDGPWAITGPNGDLIAVYEAFNDWSKPAVVLA
jgi:tRNA pseudouridine55 synthase